MNVCACVYASVPSDIGAFMAAEEMIKSHGCKCKRMTCFSGKSKGALSGGTLATALSMMSGAQHVHLHVRI